MAFVTARLSPARSALEFHRPHPLAPFAKPDEVLLSFALLRFPEFSASVPALPATAALIRSVFSWKALIKRFFVCLPDESIDIRAGKFGDFWTRKIGAHLERDADGRPVEELQS